MTRRQQRMVLVGLLLTGVVVAVGLSLGAFWENVQFFFSPTDVVAHKAPQERNFRLGGLVVDGSLQRQGDGLTVVFEVTDTANNVPISYTGILPDLFKEGQGIVATGKLNDKGVFIAEEVLAKHDENYMPPEVADALKTAKNVKMPDTHSGSQAPAPTPASETAQP
jgi:cytochrome c-type biogenesis protein CcmE